MSSDACVLLLFRCPWSDAWWKDESVKRRSLLREYALPLLTMFGLGVLILAYGSPKAAISGERVRLAYFPNVTHAPALVGVARGDFQRALGGKVSVDAKVFNAGPEAMEALLAGEVDVAYVGPSPAINTYLKSNGKALRVLAGACNGGAALVARPGANIHSLEDLAGKRLAVPQIGGTQDISARYFLAKNGLTPLEKGGSVQIIPIKNPDILALFQRGELDAAWVPEPWASRLQTEANAEVVVDERDLWEDHKFPTTVVVARTEFLTHHPGQVAALLQAHRQSVEWLNQQPDEAQKIVNEELKRLTGKPLPPEVLSKSWSRVAFTVEVKPTLLQAFADAAALSGYLPTGKTDVSGLLDPLSLDLARRTAPAR